MKLSEVSVSGITDKSLTGINYVYVIIYTKSLETNDFIMLNLSHCISISNSSSSLGYFLYSWLGLYLPLTSKMLI